MGLQQLARYTAASTISRLHCQHLVRRSTGSAATLPKVCHKCCDIVLLGLQEPEPVQAALAAQKPAQVCIANILQGHLLKLQLLAQDLSQKHESVLQEPEPVQAALPAPRPAQFDICMANILQGPLLQLQPPRPRSVTSVVMWFCLYFRSLSPCKQRWLHNSQPSSMSALPTSCKALYWSCNPDCVATSSLGGYCYCLAYSPLRSDPL